jgi:Putative rhamnosyl transferase
MARNLDHVLLTRFNLPTDGVEGLIRAREGWLRERVGLFNAYCAPSVYSQTCQNFRWIIYFDPDGPQWLNDWISKNAPGRFTPVFRSSVTAEDVVIDIRALLGDGSSILVTSNIDNDDSLALDFVERIQGAASSIERIALYITYGLIKNETRIYLRRDARNAFCSVVESWESPSTCWCDWHNLLGNSMKVVQLDGDPGWLQVVHGRNVSNRVRGRLVSPSQYVRLFPGLFEDVSPVPLRARAGDVIFARPVRSLKEAGRAAVKGIAMRALGKEGLTRVKTLWVSRYGRLNL